MTDKALGYLGIMRKAGKLAIGETDAGSAVRSGKACLLCLAQDASDNARKRAEGFVYQHHTPLIRLPYDKQTISDLVGKPGCSMLSISDLGLAAAFTSALALFDAAQYAPAEKQLKEKQAAVNARRNGKRRNNV